MAGGTSIWISKDAKNDPREIFNLRLLYLVVALAWAGCFYGFDTGNIGGILTLPSFKHAFGIDTLTKTQAATRTGDIAAMLAAGGSLGALLAAPCSDFLGRKGAVMVAGIVFLIGAVMQMIAYLPTLYAGRFIGGMGVGASSMLAPQFLAENSPKSVRGSATASYNLMILFSLSMAFWINYAVSLWKGPNIKNDNSQWRIAMGIQLIPGALMVFMVPFIPETPRYLIAHGKGEQGLKNLCRLRKLPEDHPYIIQEYNEVVSQVNHEQEARQGHSYWLVLKDIFLIRSNFRRFSLAVMLFVFHKFTGTDSLNYYAPEIFVMIGVKSGSTSLLTTGVYGVVKFVTTVAYVTVIVDRVGRRLPLIIGACMQATAMLYLALYIKYGDPLNSSGGTKAGGVIGIIWIYIYAFGWSFGHSVACYVVAAEIFPSRIRSVSMSVCFFVNWIVDYGITKATPLMLANLGWGTFLLYSLLTYIGAVYIYLCLPELRGRSIESMDDLFENSLWTMWKHAYPTDEEKVRRDVREEMDAKGETAADHVENLELEDGVKH